MATWDDNIMKQRYLWALHWYCIKHRDWGDRVLPDTYAIGISRYHRRKSGATFILYNHETKTTSFGCVGCLITSTIGQDWTGLEEISYQGLEEEESVCIGMKTGWVLGAGCWVLGAGCWVLGAGLGGGEEREERGGETGRWLVVGWVCMDDLVTWC
ncbi:hypothetical protein EYC80_004293 [Monilinia laxa]|uniref:Uncharacterized protein n=1 Tax=Monilinia laxa TaxID=61186 RepID=A0A5N6KMT6_MONLA|nr:hypothetical protein EYC80_004293 [Monilinia laxa]